MLRVEHLTLETDLLLDHVRHPELFLQPKGHRLEERPDPRRRKRQVRLQETFELEPGLVVEGYPFEIAWTDASRLQAVLHGSPREAMIVLLSTEALLLGSGNDLTVTNQASGRIVIEG